MCSIIMERFRSYVTIFIMLLGLVGCNNIGHIDNQKTVINNNLSKANAHFTDNVSVVSFSINSFKGVINSNDNSITVSLPSGTNLSALIAKFSILPESDVSSVSVNGVTQVSGVTKNDFTRAVLYTVLLKDGGSLSFYVTARILFYCVKDGSNPCGCLVQNDGSNLMWYGTALTNNGQGYSFGQESLIVKSFNANGGHCGFTDWRIPSLIVESPISNQLVADLPESLVLGDWGQFGNYLGFSGYTKGNDLATFINSYGFNLQPRCDISGAFCTFLSSSIAEATKSLEAWYMWGNSDAIGKYSIAQKISRVMFVRGGFMNAIWESGSNNLNQHGKYPNNIGGYGYPGARYGAASWRDKVGNFWLMGGCYDDGINSFSLNDLWQYNITTKQWIWESGANTVNQVGSYPSNVGGVGGFPGARFGSVSWVDSSGDLWLFGGSGYDGFGNLGSLNDLWQYNITTKQWIWESGANTVNQVGSYPSNVGGVGGFPGARFGSVSWVDSSGNLWLFGGYDNLGFLNDLWQYNITTKQWIWESGANTLNQVGSYPSNVGGVGGFPGARFGSISWVDSSGNLWLFGGSGYDGFGNSGFLNDLWQYNITTKQWIWESGANTVDQAGDYFAGIGNAGGYPGARSGGVSWVGESGNIFLFGGSGFDYINDFGWLNDIWEYNLTTNAWTWLAGVRTVDQFGNYSSGLINPGNYPGGRQGSASWADMSGNFWLFGGAGDNSLGLSGYFNDLWMFQPINAQFTK